jgi:formylglycine-generating enzyme required for sulfatase activity
MKTTFYRYPLGVAVLLLLLVGPALIHAQPHPAPDAQLASARAASGQQPTHNVPLSEEVYVPAGEFLRGCTADLAGKMGCFEESRPLHAVYLDAFYIDKTEVTNAQYADCVENGPCAPPLSNSSTRRASYYGNPQFADFPVIHVDWERADTYCHWVRKRLPTEAEWEKAARGTDHRLFPWGNDPLTCEKCNCNTWHYNAAGQRYEVYCVGDTSPVGGYPDHASPYGALDMVGNVREWVNDLYDKHYFIDAPFYNPPGPETTVTGEHLVRGGSWKGTYTHSNTWGRLDEADIYETHLIGFRCARDGPAPTPTPSPTATPNPYAVATVGPAGGALWVSKADHLTLLTIHRDTLQTTQTITLSYETLVNAHGALQGNHHFFSVDVAAPPDGTWFPPAGPITMEVALGYRETYSARPETLRLYQAGAAGWITSSISPTLHYPDYLVTEIYQSGLYGLLGQTHRTYLPLLLRDTD